MTRRFSHFLILGLLACLPILTGLVGARTSLRTSPLLGGGPPEARAEEQAVPTSTVSASQTNPQSGNTASAPTAPARPPVKWVQAFVPTVLWSSDGQNAANLGTMPQWTAFRQIGIQSGSRIMVEYPGDGISVLPARGWVDAANLGPGGPPKPEYILANGGNVSPSSGVAVPRRIAQAWPQGISAQFAAVVDGESGEVLWGRDAHGEVAPASLTKIITSLVALDRSRLTDRVTVQVDSRTMYESTVMGLTPGENLSMETLLFGLMLPSGNDAALAIAQQVAGSEPAFADLMNAKATQLGLVNSHFVNPHGLDANGHDSSAYDLIAFARAGMRDPTFARLAGTRRFDGDGHTLYNLNRLLDMYPKADGIKVGYTDNAGRAIVASATQDGRRVYCALLRSYNPTAEAQALLEWTFRGFVWQ
jgi:hypothetical protein